VSGSTSESCPIWGVCIDGVNVYGYAVRGRRDFFYLEEVMITVSFSLNL
jgi:hypothetical protein